MIIHPYIIAFKTKTIILYHFNKPTRSFFVVFHQSSINHGTFHSASHNGSMTLLPSSLIGSSAQFILCTSAGCYLRADAIVVYVVLYVCCIYNLSWLEQRGSACVAHTYLELASWMNHRETLTKVSSTNKSKHVVDNWGSIWPAAVSSGTNDRPKSKDTKSKRYAAGVVVSKWDPKSQHTEESSWKTTTHQRRGT